MNNVNKINRMTMSHINSSDILFAALIRTMLLTVLLFVYFMPSAEAAVCGKRYVAGGDYIPAGAEVDEDERYPEVLLNDHLAKYGYCLYNTAEEGATSTSYITGGQLATTWNRWPDLITLTLGGENTPIVDLITDCLDKVRDHDFIGANLCAAQIQANTSAWNKLNSDLITLFQYYKTIMAGRPQLVVAVTTYPNPYPSAASTALNIALLCVPLIDTIPTCTIRWLQLPLALTMIDTVIQRLNATIANALQPFTIGYQGRFVLVDIYSKFQSHCMKMDVSIKTTVEHPEQQGAVHKHDSSRDFGCTTPWFVEGDTGRETPNYLDPAAIGILTQKSQTTEGMGVNVNADGHKCIADAIWEADTIEPGVTPLKWKLRIPEAPNSDICN